MEVAQSSAAEAREVTEASEDSGADTREQASNHKDEVATNTTTTEGGEEVEEVEGSAGEIMTSHNGTEIHRLTSEQTGR